MPSIQPILHSLNNLSDAQNKPLSDFQIRGHSSQCSSLIELREHLLIGISPFNSRFSPDYVESLLTWGYKTFSSVDVLLPDEESAAALLLATGASPTKALRKTRKELNRHRRSLAKILERAGEKSSEIRVIDFSDYFNHEKYTTLRKTVQDAFETCEKFRSACLNMSSQAICGRASGTGAINDKFEPYENAGIAIPYIFAEMPFYLCSPELLEANTSVLAYHREWPMGDALLAGEFPFGVDSRQGHGIVSVVAPSKLDCKESD